MSGYRWPIGRRKITDRRLADDLAIQRDVPVRGREPQVVADLFRPRVNVQPKLTIVSLHGFGGRRQDLTQFAITLALEGASVCNVGWRGYRTGHAISTSVDDISHAVAFAIYEWGRPVILVAWADGTLPAAIVALGGSTVHGAAPSAFVGISGYYGWSEPVVPARVVNDQTIAVFGGSPSAHPTRWDRGNPYRYLDRPGHTAFRLMAGSEDLQLLDSMHFHGALLAAGSAAQLEVVDRATSFELIMPRLQTGRRVARAVLETAREAVPS